MKIEDPQLREMAAGATTRLDLWVKFLRVSQARTVLEVGVWKADFTKHMLEQCEAIERYYMLDPWAHLPDWNKPLNLEQEVLDRAYEESVQKTAFASDRRVVLRGRTRDVIGSIPDESLDFAYIDGDHTLRGITIDLIKVLPKVKTGGFIGGDDFAKDVWQHPSHYEPTLVCPFSVYFAEAMKLPIVALPFDQFLMQKRTDGGFSFTDTTGAYKDLSIKKLSSGWANISPIWWAKHKLKKAGILK
jgi:Methyltransferase domain